MSNNSQSIVSALEGYIISGNMERSLLYGGSTLIATMISNYVPEGVLLQSGEVGTQYVVEPIRAGLLSLLGQYAFLRKGEKNRYMKTFAESFIVTGSSAGINRALIGPKVSARGIGGNSYSQAREVLINRQETIVVEKNTGDNSYYYGESIGVLTAILTALNPLVLFSATKSIRGNLGYAVEGVQSFAQSSIV